MEKEKFIHRNLGARNILVGQKNKVKIAGFGMTKCADDPDFNFRRGQYFMMLICHETEIYTVENELHYIMHCPVILKPEFFRLNIDDKNTKKLVLFDRFNRSSSWTFLGIMLNVGFTGSAFP